MVDEFQAVLTKVNVLSPRVKQFFFELTPRCTFKTGQFFQVLLNKNGKEIKKSYSIASLPNDKQVEFCINKVKDGFASTFFHNMKEGDKLTFQGAHGTFVPNYDFKGEYVFVATGTGITPLQAMIKDLLQRGVKQNMYLIFGNRYEEDIIYRKELEALAKKHKNFHPFFILSREKDWPLKGYVQDHFENILKTSENKLVYLCGVPDMVLAAKKALLAFGCDRTCIKQELYT